MLALLHAWALVLFIVWLIAAWTGGYLSERKGYGPKPGLASGLLLTALGPLIWLLVPARAHSDWKIKGPFGDKPKGDTAQS